MSGQVFMLDSGDPEFDDFLDQAVAYIQPMFVDRVRELGHVITSREEELINASMRAAVSATCGVVKQLILNGELP